MTTKPAKRCRHRHVADKFGDTTHDWNGDIIYEVEFRECLDCSAWLPLGPAADDDPNVAVEVRAAELVATFHESDWPFSSWHTTADEDAGWRHDDRCPHTRDYDAGRLARTIVEPTLSRRRRGICG